MSCSHVLSSSPDINTCVYVFTFTTIQVSCAVCEGWIPPGKLSSEECTGWSPTSCSLGLRVRGVAVLSLSSLICPMRLLWEGLSTHKVVWGGLRCLAWDTLYQVWGRLLEASLPAPASPGCSCFLCSPSLSRLISVKAFPLFLHWSPKLCRAGGTGTPQFPLLRKPGCLSYLIARQMETSKDPTDSPGNFPSHESPRVPWM
jgi:hypothetical protein